MDRRHWLVAVGAASVFVGAGAAIAVGGGDVPRDLSRDVPRDDDFVFMDDLSPEEQVAARRIETENLMIQGGEPYTQEDVDRELAELLEAERLFPQEVQDTPLPEVSEIPLNDDADDADDVNITIDDGR